MEEQIYIRSVIQEYMDKEKAINPRFSLRMLAQKLDTPPAALSSFLNGKRKFSKKMATKIFENMGLSPEYFFELNEKFSEGKETPKKEKSVEKLKLQSSLYYLLSDPLYYSYLSLVETVFFKDDDIWAASVLETTAHKISKIKSRLIDLKLIKYEDKKLIATNVVLGSTDNIPNHSLKTRHAQNMEDAKQAIFNVEIDQRYFAFETLAFDKEDLSIVQSKINQLMDDLIWLSKKGSHKDSVYEFCANYFPRTKNV